MNLNRSVYFSFFQKNNIKIASYNDIVIVIYPEKEKCYLRDDDILKYVQKIARLFKIRFLKFQNNLNLNLFWAVSIYF